MLDRARWISGRQDQEWRRHFVGAPLTLSQARGISLCNFQKTGKLPVPLIGHLGASWQFWMPPTAR